MENPETGMNIPSSKRITVGLSIGCLSLLFFCCYLFVTFGWLHIRVAWASEQTQIFEDMRAKALQGDPAGAADSLGYVVWYYRSGAKQVAGSRLDRMVERERAHAVRDIIDYLKAETRDDLGDKPEPWIQKYGKK